MHPQTGGQHSSDLERLVLHLSPLSPPPGSHLLCFVTTLELPPPRTPTHPELRGPACQASAGLAQGLRQQQLPRYWGAPAGLGFGANYKVAGLCGQPGAQRAGSARRWRPHSIPPGTRLPASCALGECALQSRRLQAGSAGSADPGTGPPTFLRSPAGSLIQTLLSAKPRALSGATQAQTGWASLGRPCC